MSFQWIYHSNDDDDDDDESKKKHTRTKQFYEGRRHLFLANSNKINDLFTRVFTAAISLFLFSFFSLQNDV